MKKIFICIFIVSCFLVSCSGNISLEEKCSYTGKIITIREYDNRTYYQFHDLLMLTYSKRLPEIEIGHAYKFEVIDHGTYADILSYQEVE